ncbi:DUF1102 domain-containing protein [Natrinema amylolyticum]|uniref:DUF1102 domain-containing protein n=1 Tax=Natrinema amylolyticum TaxID=2878679 RepID=UPI001CFAA091|nr:DUF1102 domain-containing protein [Natrinema amylolyticum]
MERRKFLIGAGSTAIGASALVGTGAFSGVVSERTASVEIAHDRNAYLGLHEIPDSPNESYVDYDSLDHLRIQMDPDNPNDTGNGESTGPNQGVGVNSNSVTWFNDLFQICNQGKQEIGVYLFKVGDNADRVVFYNGDREGPCHGTTLGVGECTDIGMATATHGLSSDDDLLDNLLIVALGTKEYTDKSTAREQINDDSAVHNDEYDERLEL